MLNIKNWLIGFLLLTVTFFAHADKPYRQMGFIIDPDISPYMGAEIVNIGLRGYQYLDDRWFSSSEYNQSTWMILGRFGKWVIFDQFFAQLGKIVQHEFFGHGSRARELDLGVDDHRFELFNSRTVIDPIGFAAASPYKRSAISTAGYEATAVMNKVTRKRWLATDRIDSREASFYIWSWLDATQFAFGSQHDEKFQNSSDMAQYVNALTNYYGRQVLGTDTLKRLMVLNFFDPFAFYSLYNIFNYILTGEQEFYYYTFTWGDLETIPVFRTVLAPFGPQYMWTQYYITPSRKLIESRVRYGNRGGVESYGLGVTFNEFWRWGIWNIGTQIDIWRQPRSSQPFTNRHGIAVVMLGNLQWSENFEWVVELGWKSSGYVPGERLDTQPIIRGGFQWNI